MYIGVKEVKPLEDYKLGVLFDNGIAKIYDFSPNFKLEVFTPLKDYSLFRNIQVDSGGYGISWNEELDLSEADLWIKGIEVKEESIFATQNK